MECLLKLNGEIMEEESFNEEGLITKLRPKSKSEMKGSDQQ